MNADGTRRSDLDNIPEEPEGDGKKKKKTKVKGGKSNAAKI